MSLAESELTGPQQYVLEEVDRRTEPEPAGKQNAHGKLWTGTAGIRQDASGDGSPYTADEIRDAAAALVDTGRLFGWHGLLAPATKPHLRAIVQHEAQQDVTAEKRFEQNLSLFKEQAEESEKAIFITDADGTIQYVNPAFERMTGYSATEAIGKNPRILKSGHQDDAFYAELWAQITAGEVWEADLTNQTKHGELYEVRQKIIPVTDEYGEITQFVAIEEDTTEEILRTQSFDVLNRVLRHNLRNALNVIDGNAERLEAEEMDADAGQAAIRVIREQAQSLRKIAEKTAEVREIWNPAGDHREWERLDLEELIETYRRQYPDADITAKIAGDGEIQVRNAELFALALAEAVENALTHADRSPPDVAITMERDADATQVRISVADTGPGIPEHERDVIASGTETPLSHGLGVGFWLMEWVTTVLGGELDISDNEPRGSVVTFRLPSAG